MGPMPFMCKSSSFDLNGPLASLLSTILSASMGPMPGNVLKISFPARFMEIGSKKIFATAGGRLTGWGTLDLYRMADTMESDSGGADGMVTRGSNSGKVSFSCSGVRRYKPSLTLGDPVIQTYFSAISVIAGIEFSSNIYDWFEKRLTARRQRPRTRKTGMLSDRFFCSL